MEDKSTRIFRDAPVPKAVFMNIIPSIISMIMIIIYNLADTFFIGQTHDPLMVAAVSVASPAFFFFMAVGNLFGVGGTSLISRSLGAGDSSKAKHISAFCFWSSVVIGLLSAVLIVAFSRPICLAIGASENTIDYASEYLNILATAIPLLIIGNAFSNIIRSEGSPKIAMFGTILGNLVNVILDPIFISVLGMNVRGAAIATVIGNICSGGFYILFLCSKKTMLSIRPRDFKIGGGVASGVFAIGVPAALNSILMTITSIVTNSLMKQHGDLAIAGLGVAMKINSIVVMVLVGMGVGIQPLLGYNFGAHNRKRFVAIFRFSLLVAFVLSSIMTVICYCAAGPLVSLFLTDPEAYSYGFMICRIYIYAGPVLGFMFVFINAVQSTGSAVAAMILSVCRQGLVLIPLLFLFDALFGTVQTLVMATPISDYITVIVGAIVFTYTYRKKFKQFEIEDQNKGAKQND